MSLHVDICRCVSGVVRDFIEEVAVQFCTATFFLSVRGCKAVSKILPLHPWEEC